MRLDMADTNFLAIWRAGSGAQWWVTGLNFNDFRAKDLAYFNQGLRLISLRNHGGSYTGVWHPGSGAQWWAAWLNFNDFKAKDLDYFNQGLHLVCLRVREDGTFTGVWRPGSGAQWWVTGLNYSDFKAKDQTYFNQGLRLVDIELHNGAFTGSGIPAQELSGGTSATTSRCWSVAT